MRPNDPCLDAISLVATFILISPIIYMTMLSSLPYKSTDDALKAFEGRLKTSDTAKYTPSSFLKNETFAEKAQGILGLEAYAIFTELVKKNNMKKDLDELVSHNKDGINYKDMTEDLDVESGLQFQDADV